MDLETEGQSFSRLEEFEDEEEKKKKWTRPPSSYGSMKSDPDSEDEEDHEEIANVFSPAFTVPLPPTTTPEGKGLQFIRSASPETLCTETTQQTKPPGALVIQTRSSDPGDVPEEEEIDPDDIIYYDSPEPPEPIELDDAMQTDENDQPGRLHPEQDLPHIFRSIQNALTDLTKEQMLKFKMWFLQWEPDMKMQQVMEGDLLDFVDRILETLGMDRALMHTITTLDNINKKPEADKLREDCKRALIRFHLNHGLIRQHQVIHEGVVRAGKQNLLHTVYVEPQISTCSHGGVDPSHEFPPQAPPPFRVPVEETLVSVNGLFRLRRSDGDPVRTVVTSGLPGIGMSVSAAKFSLDWAEMRANKDLQFVFKISFQTFWLLRKSERPFSKEMSIMDVIEYYHPECKDMKYLEDQDCRFLLIMDSFDCYQTLLDWQNAPVINDNYTKAHPDVLLVNIVRGSVLRGARLWILGRRAAISQIPTQFIDVFTEIQGFSDEMKDRYFSARFSDAELAGKIVARYKLLPTLKIITRQPFICWLVAMVFDRCYRYRNYGTLPPRLTPFYINMMIVQINRRLQFYHGKGEHDLKWSVEDKRLLTRMGRMALRMLERKCSVFSERDVEECELELMDVTVWSGLCTEIHPADSHRTRTFCFIHYTFQEFMAALYVFTMFRTESRNVLDSTRRRMSPSKLAVSLIQCAVDRTLGSPLGHYDLFLRFLCGLFSPECHDNLLRGCLYDHNAAAVSGRDDVQRLLEQTIHTAEQNRTENLKECLREMTQVDE